MPKDILAYIAGFLDGDGCLMAQLVKRTDYKFGFQIRLSIVFYQRADNIAHLKWIKSKLKNGYIRIRNDYMSEYTIVGYKDVREVLEIIYPYLKLKKSQAKLLIKISKISKKPNVEEFLSYCRLVDESAKLNYTKKRKIFTQNVIRYLEKHKIFPRND